MSPRGREPAVQLLALRPKLRKLRLMRREVLDGAEHVGVSVVCKLGRDHPKQEQLFRMATQLEDQAVSVTMRAG